MTTTTRSNWIVEQVVGALKNEKVSTGVFGILLTITFFAYTWAGDQHKTITDAQAGFVTRDEFQQEHQELHSDIERLSESVNEYIDDSRIVDANIYIRDKQLSLQIATATGADDITVQEIQQEIKHLYNRQQLLTSEHEIQQEIVFLHNRQQ